MFAEISDVHLQHFLFYCISWNVNFAPLRFVKKDFIPHSSIHLVAPVVLARQDSDVPYVKCDPKNIPPQL